MLPISGRMEPLIWFESRYKETNLDWNSELVIKEGQETQILHVAYFWQNGTINLV